MKRINLKKNLMLIALVAVLAVFMTGCGSTSTQPAANVEFENRLQEPFCWQSIRKLRLTTMMMAWCWKLRASTTRERWLWQNMMNLRANQFRPSPAN